MKVAIVGGGPAGLIAAEALSLSPPEQGGAASLPPLPTGGGGGFQQVQSSTNADKSPLPPFAKWADLRVDLYDAMPSLGRKFLLAGKGGLNLTHEEGREAFLSRYGARRAELAKNLAAVTA